MNEENTSVPKQPPPLEPPPFENAPPPVVRAPLNAQAKKAEEAPVEPMKGDGFGAIVEALLKQPKSLLLELGGLRCRGILTKLGILVIVFMAIYGVVMGSFSGGVQFWATPLKLTLGTLFCLVICLPSLYIFVCLSGADLRLGQVAGAMFGMAGMISLLLLGFAPVAWVFSQSTDSVVWMGVMHLVFWIIGLCFGARMVFGLVKKSSGHVQVWVLIFVLVSLQMATALRPLVGKADTLLPTEKRFFLAHWVDTMSGR